MHLLYTVVYALHVSASTLALAAMLPPLLAKKGGALHARAGWVFSLGMAVSAVSGALLAASWLLAPSLFRPGEPADAARLSGLFLVFIGALTGNAVVQAHAAILRKRAPAPQPNLRHLGTVVLLALMALVSLAVGLVAGHGLSIGYGVAGLVLSARDLAFVLRPLPDPRAYLYHHVMSMGTACISAVTAFLVLGGRRIFHTDVLLGSWSWTLWVLPGAILGPLFARAARRYRASKPSQRAPETALAEVRA